MSNWALSQATAVASTTRLTVTPNATAHTKGAWTQVVASVPTGVCGIFIATEVAVSQVYPRMFLDVGIGAAGSEVVIVPNVVIASVDYYRDGGKHLYLPIQLPAGQRLSLRLQSADASISSIAFQVTFQLGTPLTPVGGTVTVYGADTANTRGTNVTAGASLAYGTAVQFVASTPYRARGIAVTMFGSDGGTDGYFIGSRVVYGTSTVAASPVFTHCVYGLETKGSAQLIHFVPCSIPAGSDLRIQSYSVDPFLPRRGYVLYLLH